MGVIISTQPQTQSAGSVEEQHVEAKNIFMGNLATDPYFKRLLPHTQNLCLSGKFTKHFILIFLSLHFT